MAKDNVPVESLPGEINIATRPHHTTLNRLITSRLPLALPPHASTPALYTTGLLHFSHIFLTFESLWNDLLPSPSNPPTSPLLSFLLVDPWDADASSYNVQDGKQTESVTPSPQMLEFLFSIRPAGLSRSGRLKRDLEVLTGMKGTDLSVLLSRFPGPKVQKFCYHIRRQVRDKPHTLIAYAWCFYMAVFSGGRWIRSELVKAGDDFWKKASDHIAEDEKLDLGEAGLSFWNFSGEQDGEDIKAEFKRRLAGADELFTPIERADVVDEAKRIFELCKTLVDELDEKLMTDMTAVASLQNTERTMAKEKKIEATPLTSNVSSVPLNSLRRPEVAGALVALGCLAWVVLGRFESWGMD